MELSNLERPPYFWGECSFLECSPCSLPKACYSVDVALLQVMVGSNSTRATLIRNFVVTSTLCAMTSTLTSLLLDREYRLRVNEPVRAACPCDRTEAIDFLIIFQEQYLPQHWHNKTGFLYVAIIHSLPYVLLLWAMLFSSFACLIIGMDTAGALIVPSLVVLVISVVATMLVKWNLAEDDPAQMLGNWTTLCLNLLCDAIHYPAQMLGNWRTLYLNLLRDAILQIRVRLPSGSSAPAQLASANENDTESLV